MHSRRLNRNQLKRYVHPILIEDFERRKCVLFGSTVREILDGPSYSTAAAAAVDILYLTFDDYNNAKTNLVLKSPCCLVRLSLMLDNLFSCSKCFECWPVRDYLMKYVRLWTFAVTSEEYRSLTIYEALQSFYENSPISHGNLIGIFIRDHMVFSELVNGCTYKNPNFSVSLQNTLSTDNFFYNMVMVSVCFESELLFF